MLTKQHRLRSSRRIGEVRRTGRSYANRWLVLSVQDGEESETRFAFSVSRRIGGAVTRNRTKRHLREAVRAYLGCVAPGWDVVLVARPTSSTAPHADLVRAVGDLLRRSQLVNAPAIGTTPADCKDV